MCFYLKIPWIVGTITIIVDIQYSMYMTFHYNKFDFHFVDDYASDYHYLTTPLPHFGSWNVWSFTQLIVQECWLSCYFDRPSNALSDILPFSSFHSEYCIKCSYRCVTWCVVDCTLCLILGSSFGSVCGCASTHRALSFYLDTSECSGV